MSEKRENEGLRLSLEEFETWLMRFCFGELCIDWKEPPVCQYGHNPYAVRCDLINKEAQEPEDYCPIVKFINWLKGRKVNDF